MKKRLLDFIWCPQCHEELALSASEEKNGEILTGSLSCKACGSAFPILKGIPRFIPSVKSSEDLRKVYADSFGHQWTTYNWIRDEDEFEYFQITDFTKADLKDKVVLDAGCGGGRVARFVSGYCREIVCLDYSIAVEKAQELCQGREQAHFIQSDINFHPLRNDMFDVVYSHGVIHHTPNTKRSFDCLLPVVKRGGLLYIAVFRKAFLPLRWSDSFWRGILNKLPISALDKVCGAMSYLSYLPRAVFWKRFFWFSLQRTHEIRKCCLYDWYGPTYHHEHTVEEVMDWFQTNGYGEVKYINAWPYCPPEEKYATPGFLDSLRIGGLLGVRGRKKE